MYGQPNHNPPFGQAPPPPNLQFQQRPQGPLLPAPPPHMVQGRPPSLHHHFPRGPFYPLPPPPPPHLAATNAGFYIPPPILPSPPLATSSGLGGGDMVIHVPPPEPIEANDVQGGDSDMEMEDDITFTDKDEKTGNPTEDLLNAEGISGKENPIEQQISEDSIIRHETSSELLNPHQQSEDPTLKTGNSLLSNSFSPAGDPVAAETTTSKNDSTLLKDDSPIRLLQGYASGDSSENDKNDLLRDDINPSHKSADNSSASLVEGKDSIIDSTSRFSAEIADISLENIDEDSKNVKDVTSQSMDDEGAHDFSKKRKKNEEKKSKPDSASLKLDEFGRLIREGLSDSGSDRRKSDRHIRRARRDRCHSRSRSPLDRRRTRDSRRRKDKRSRSRSWSPRNQSRSRSPSHRRGGEFSNEKTRSNRSRAPECFDFTRGKCFRGASCKYVHHEAAKSDGSRRYDNKQKNPEPSSGTQNHKTKTERRNFSKFSDAVLDKTRPQEIQYEEVDWKKEDITKIDSGTVNSPSPKGDMKITLDHDHGSFRKSHELPSIDNIAEDQNPDCVSHQLNDSPLSDTLPSQTKLSNSGSIPISSQPLPSFPVPNLPPPPHLPQLPMNYPSMAPIPPFPLQSANAYSHTYQNTQFFAPPNSSWILPPPPPRPPYEFRASSQFQPSHFPPRSDYGPQIFARPNPESISRAPRSEYGPQVFIRPNSEPISSAPRRDYGPQIYIRPNSEPISSAPVTGFPPRNDYGPQIFVRPNSESMSNAPVTGFQAHEPHQPNLQLENSSSGNLRIQSKSPDILRENHSYLPSNQPSQSSSEIHPLSHTVSGNLKYHEGDESTRLPEKSGFQDTDQASVNPDFGLPRFTAHYNPYASTFEKPFGSKLSSDPPSQYDIPFNSRNTISPPGSEGKIVISTGGDQYDPLLDSIEPTNARKRVEQIENTHGVTHDLENLDEKNNDEIALVASTASLDNDEFDAEAGVVENESMSDHGGTENSRDLKETDKTKKTKRKKDSSRSTKPFKMAIAEFVKDVLKPSWRQGNMSKEAFKTIVKKTVDKVSGAMKGHNLPKSRAKIDQYIDSSQRKLTKLVMGYVDKYVKV